MARFELRTGLHTFEAEAEQVRQGVRDFSASILGEADFRPIRVVCRDEAGALLGGLVAGAYWRWLHVDSLWVREDHRRQGHATRMLSMAEVEARSFGCANSFLDTFSFQARPLYERLGYRVVGTIPDFPAGHERYFMVKSLVPEGAARDGRAGD